MPGFQTDHYEDWGVDAPLLEKLHREKKVNTRNCADGVDRAAEEAQ